ncbi:unnamed protein product, partial [Mesorhabditis spiculigera]
MPILRELIVVSTTLFLLVDFSSATGVRCTLEEAVRPGAYSTCFKEEIEERSQAVCKKDPPTDMDHGLVIQKCCTQITACTCTDEEFKSIVCPGEEIDTNS